MEDIMDIFQKITEELAVQKWQVEAAVKLIDEGCTIPFISRYGAKHKAGYTGHRRHKPVLSPLHAVDA